MRYASLFVALIVAPLAMAQDAAPLKRVVKEGDKAKYALKVETEIGGTPIKFTANVLEKVTKVKEDGTFVLSSEQQDAMLDMGGTQSPAPAGVGGAVSTSYALDGSITEISGDESTPEAYRLSNIQSVLWPKDPVTVGSKWTATIAENKKNSTPSVEAKYEILAKESVGTHSVYKISFESIEKEGSDPASSKGTIWIDIASGQVIKNESEWKNAPIAGQVINGKVSMTLTE